MEKVMKKVFATLAIATFILVGCFDQDCPELCKQETLEIFIVETHDAVSINWQDSLKADVIEIIRDGKTIALMKNTRNFYVDTLVTPETSYLYSVVNYGECEKNIVDGIVVTTPRDPKPLPFTEFNAEKVGSDAVFLTWENKDETIDFFAIMRNDEQVDITTEKKYLDKELDAGEYTYRVIAVNSDGQTASLDVNITIETQASVPGQPQNLTAQKDFRSISLSWDAVENTIHYNIKSAGENVNVLTTSITFDSLEVDSLYNFEVTAINEVGESEPAQIDVRTRGRFTALWDANTEDDLAGYLIYLINDGNIDSLIYNGPDTTCSFVVDFEPCVAAKAYDWNENISELSEIVCFEN